MPSKSLGRRVPSGISRVSTLAVLRVLAWLLAPFLPQGADDPLAWITHMEQFRFDRGAAGAGFIGLGFRSALSSQ